MVPTAESVCLVCAEMRISPTKPCGKGNKRKQDELDEDEDEDEEGDEQEQPTWVEAFANELATDEGSEEDPDYEVAPSNHPLTWHLYIKEVCSLAFDVSAHTACKVTKSNHEVVFLVLMWM